MAFDKVIDSAKLESEITATANAIRAKTGETSKIRWEENTGFATAVNAITTGGGSSEDVRYVTFMNDDGTVELGKKAVATGDDCADPIARGVFDTPTKEPTAQYTYTFSGGWATTPGGGKDANALKAVTEDRTVYANFIATVRSYTITFYDSDRTTVLTTKSVAYGSVPSYTPTKSGFDFVGWEPNLTAVTGETSYTAKWTEEVSFATASWARIAEISASGEAPNYFKVGDTKTFRVSSHDVTVEIGGFDHDILSDGSGKAGITMVFKNSTYQDAWVHGTSATYAGAYFNKTDGMITNIANYYLPSDLRKVLKTVKKEYDDSYNSGSSPTIKTLDCKVFLLSLTELGYNTTNTNNYSTLGERYPLYPLASKLPIYKSPSGTAQDYWTRSLNRVGVCSPCYVRNDGIVISLNGSNLNGLSKYLKVGFCV